MPTYIDIHELPPGTTAADLAQGHHLDMQAQTKHGVEYLKYWLNLKNGKGFCLCTAPNAEAAIAVHREAHGMIASKIMEVTPDVAEAFMGASEIDEGGAVRAPGSGELDPGTRTVLFTDIVDSTGLTQHQGDDGAMAILEVHDRIVRDALFGLGGREVKHTGDGIMAAFFSAASATRCGIKIQQDLAAHRASRPDLPLQVRIGIAAGEPIERHNDFFGTTVQLASRLCTHAEPGHILISNTIAELCAGKALRLHSEGLVALKGFDEPLHVHRVEITSM